MVPVSTPSIIERAPCGALTPFIDRYIAEVTAQGYAPRSVHHQVSLLLALGEWLHRTRRKPADLSEPVASAFLRQYQKWQHAHVGAAAALRRFVEMLRQLGVVAPVAEAPRTAAQELVREYEQFLSRDRALSKQTVQAWTPYVIRFLRETFGKRELALRALRPAHVTKFTRRHACRFGSSYRRKLVTSLRSFLRYLHYSRAVESERGQEFIIADGESIRLRVETNSAHHVALSLVVIPL